MSIQVIPSVFTQATPIIGSTQSRMRTTTTIPSRRPLYVNIVTERGTQLIFAGHYTQSSRIKGDMHLPMDHKQHTMSLPQITIVFLHIIFSRETLQMSQQRIQCHLHLNQCLFQGTISVDP